MNVYVETNFLLELAFRQEQFESCEGILKLCEARTVGLAVPAYSLAEPYEVLTRRQNHRRRMKRELDIELQQLARSTAHKDRLRGFRDLAALLMNISDEVAEQLEEVRLRLINAADLTPLDASVLASATQHQATHGLSAQDAFVYSSVLSHLEQVRTSQSCFLNKNTRDFEDQAIVRELARYNCKLLPRFDAGYAFIRHALRVE